MPLEICDWIDGDGMVTIMYLSSIITALRQRMDVIKTLDPSLGLEIWILALSQPFCVTLSLLVQKEMQLARNIKK